MHYKALHLALGHQLSEARFCEKCAVALVNTRKHAPWPPTEEHGITAHMQSRRIAYVANSYYYCRYVKRDQAVWLKQAGFEMHLCVPCTEAEQRELSEVSQAEVHRIPMARDINPQADLATLRQLVPMLRAIQPGLLFGATPKGGLLGCLAGALARVPARVYGCQGLRLETTQGAKYALLAATERSSCALAHEVLCISPSLRRELLARKLCPRDKAQVLTSGGATGVDCDTLKPDPALRQTVREGWQVGAEAQVLGYVGRLTRDKGVDTLVKCFAELAEQHPELHLVLVGGFEEGDPVDAATRHLIETHPRIRNTGFTLAALELMQGFDLFVFPSLREGLGTACLEASALGVPIVAYASTGIVDAVAHERTGTLVPTGDAAALSAAIERYLGDPMRRRTHGEAGPVFIREHFDKRVFVPALATYFERLLDRKGA